MFDWFRKEKPFSGFAGFGGGLPIFGGGGYQHPFDNMSNFPGATKLGNDTIYYSTSGVYSFTDPNSGGSRYRFTVVGGGGATQGDGGGWYGNTGAGGGGVARGELVTADTLIVGVGEGGASQGFYNPGSTTQSPSWESGTITGNDNGINRVWGRGGVSYVITASTDYFRATGGMHGLYGYHATTYPVLNTISPAGYGAYNGRGFWDNGGGGTTHPSVTNPYTENGGIGGCSAHASGSMSPYPNPQVHPLDGWRITGDNSWYVGTAGESKSYAGAGGGGGSDGGGQPYPSGAGANGGTSPGLNSLLSGSGLVSNGGNGANVGTDGVVATQGTVGGGAGGNSRWNPSDTWGVTQYGGTGIVIVEYLGAV